METELKELWEKTLNIIKGELTEVSFNTWIKSCEPISISSNTIIISVPNSFTQDILEKRYKDLVINSIEAACSKTYELEFVIASELQEVEEKNEENKNTSKKDGISVTVNDEMSSTLNPKYTFDSFVIGNSNRFAHAASLAVAESPAKAYNPLFIYGGVGLGKTHLMHAIGHYILQNNPNAKVVYVSSEKFTNELINAIKDDKNEEFRTKYRSVDVLLIDDIQFIAGKERIQEEFFHTFNALHESGKQIIISSDKPPKDIQLLEDRLKSRFEWGLIADISNPDYETRVAILRKKAQMDNIIIDDEILSNIATKVDSNIRELEGTLNKLIAISSLTHQPISMLLSEQAINDVVSNKERVLSIEFVQDKVAKYFNVTIEDLKGSRRSNDIAFPRQVAMYICRNVAQISLPKIGAGFGKRDHSTVMHACKKIEDDLKKDPNVQLIVENVKNSILCDNDEDTN